MIATDKDIQVIEHLSKEFYSFSQQIIEDNYLQPLTEDSYGSQLPEKIKVNLKDGDLERPLHGGMHVGRAQFWTLILNEKIKEMLPTYTKKVISDLSEILGLNEKHILTLIRYAVKFHDSARKNESRDLWDQDSAKRCYDFFVAQGLSYGLAELISQAAALKDHSEKYAKFLESKQIDKESIASFQYIRKLIYLSDCLDIMRCVGRYQLSRALLAFKDIPEFQPQIHTKNIIEITTHIYLIIKKQKDMLFPCVIILPNGVPLNFGDGQSCFDLNSKVVIEHADNVCSVLGASIKEDFYFEKYLAEEVLLETKTAKIEAAFNPYIHGTNSFILPMLKRTNFTMVPSIEMLEQYGMAPMGGELDNPLFGGGLDSCDPPRYICFGRMLSRGNSEYGLDKISGSYTGYSLATEKDTLLMVQKYANEASACGFENINKLLIHFARAKQLGVEPLSKENYKKLQDQFNGVIQLYYLLMLLGKHIQPNFELYNNVKQTLRDTVIDSEQTRLEFKERLETAQEWGIKLNITFEKFLEGKKDLTDTVIDSIHTHFTFQKIIEKIIDLKIDIKNIYDNPTEENLRQVLSILEFPTTSVILTGVGKQKQKEVTLSETQFFTFNKPCPNASRDTYTEDWLYRYFINQHEYALENLLADFLRDKVTTNTFNKLERMALERIKTLMVKFDLLEKIAATNTDKVKFSPEEMDFMKKPFPMIIICNSEEKISLHDFANQEFRASEPLKFGEDITTIAVDTQEHQLLIMKFLKENHVQNVQVILTDQLFKSKDNKKLPRSFYTHNDGFPRLSFFAANAVPNNVIPEDKKSKEMIDAVRQYQDIKLF